MIVKDSKTVEECHNEKLLSEYFIDEKTVVFLDNTQDGAHVAHNHDENFNCQIDVSFAFSPNPTRTSKKASIKS